jgi:hypothetical protein
MELVRNCSRHFLLSSATILFIFISKKVCSAFSRTSYKIVPPTNLNKYQYNDKNEINVNINIKKQQ